MALLTIVKRKTVTEPTTYLNAKRCSTDIIYRRYRNDTEFRENKKKYNIERTRLIKEGKWKQ